MAAVDLLLRTWPIEDSEHRDFLLSLPLMREQHVRVAVHPVVLEIEQVLGSMPSLGKPDLVDENVICASGAYVWPGAVLLVEFLVRLRRGWIPAGRMGASVARLAGSDGVLDILEIAAGIGTVGIAAAKLWDTCRLLSTDGMPVWLSPLKRNAIHNGLAGCLEPRILRYGVDTDVAAALDCLDRRCPDLLLMSDGIYDGGECYEPLCRTLHALTSEHTVILLSHKKRRACEFKFFAMLAHHFSFCMVLEENVLGQGAYIVMKSNVDPCASKHSDQISLVLRTDSDDSVVSLSSHDVAVFDYDPLVHTVIGTPDAAAQSV